MSTYTMKLPPKKKLLIESLGSKTTWARQFGRIKAKRFGEAPIDNNSNKVVVIPPVHVGARTVYFTPYHDRGGTHPDIDESNYRVKPDSPSAVFLLEIEDSTDGDYNDWIVRFSIVDCKEEEINLYDDKEKYSDLVTEIQASKKDKK